jgi:hypothetical protein
MSFSTVQVSYANAIDEKSLVSFDTGYTISKVRTGVLKQEPIIVASTYEGVILALDFEGNQLWKQSLSGYMNHDIWAADITGDGVSEVFAANADGNVYCLDSKGTLLWSFKNNNVPMYTVTVVNKGNTPYIVAGSYDNSFYYLDSEGQLVKQVSTDSFSTAKPWYKKSKGHSKAGKRVPQRNKLTPNFLRPLKQKQGDDLLLMHATMNSMQSSGYVYTFDVLSDKPRFETQLKAKTSMGDIQFADLDNDGNNEIILGSTKMKGQNITLFDPDTKKQQTVPLGKLNKKFNSFGYRVSQTAVFDYKGQPHIFLLYGNDATLVPVANPSSKSEVFSSKYSYNDLWHDKSQNKLILASAQSGGSAIHVIDITKPDWQREFVNLEPPGKLARLLSNTALVKEQVKAYKADKTQKESQRVYLMSDYRKTPDKVRKEIDKNYDSPVFLGYGTLGSENWDRSQIENKTYRNKRDKRQKYDLSQSEVLAKAKKLYKGNTGAAFWGGHGNDPYFRSLDTHLKTIDVAGGKKSVMIFPEMAHYDDDFVETLDALMYPLAEASKNTNTNIFLRNKHTFWQSHIYKPGWSRLLSGEFADVFIPAMEETTDKSMELSIAARSGLWASGAVNQWGTRFSRDNTSFDRLRQHSHQMIPNHGLRQFVYHIASGATYINNFAFNNSYMSVLWDLIGTGALFVPEPSDILSYSPVNLAMLPPDSVYEDEGNNVKWTTMFNKTHEDNNQMVFSRLNGSWPGAEVTEWDFSRYAANVNDRHLNYLPEYPNGLVLMTPPQQGIYADTKAVRGKLVDKLHPLYKNIMSEFYTDGKYYYSANGKDTYPANTYYKTVAKVLNEKAKLLPITVTGDVSWVVAQTSPTNLRLTLIDGGYINPKSAVASVSFNTIKPVKVTDILNGETFETKNGKTTIQLPTGLFRFIDVELTDIL